MAERIRILRRNIPFTAAVVVFTLLFAGVNWKIADLGGQLRATERDNQSLRQDSQNLRRDGQALADQVRGLGATPVVTPQPGAVGARGPAGSAGQPVTQAQVAAAVSEYLSAHPPPRGRPPTMAELLTAVTGYLQEHPPAAGPSGATGQDGTNGRDGVDGKDGPPPTAEQIRAAVEEYLAAHPLNCPSGYHLEETTVVTTTGPQPAAVCIRNQEGQ
jgi:hypothetical protein